MWRKPDALWSYNELDLANHSLPNFLNINIIFYQIRYMTFRLFLFHYTGFAYVLLPESILSKYRKRLLSLKVSHYFQNRMDINFNVSLFSLGS